MTVTAHAARVLLAAVLAVGTAACTAAPAPTPTASVTALPSPTAAQATPTLSPGEQDLANAEAAVRALWATVNRLTNDSKAPIQDLDMVATGSTLTMFQQNLVEYRTRNWRGSGDSIVDDVTVEPAGVSAAGQSIWTVTACVDGTNTTLVDEGGRSVQGPPYRVRHKATVVKFSEAQRFLVAEDEAVSTC